MPSRRALLLPLLVGLGAGQLGCQTRCYTAFDCGDGAYCREGQCETECYVDQDCLRPPECASGPCEPKGARCNAVGRCVGAPEQRVEPRLRDVSFDVVSEAPKGWDAPPGTGQSFVLDRLEIAGDGRGYDLDGACLGPGDCVDNALEPLGDLANAQIRQGVLGGESLLLLELAGLELPFTGNARSVTVKLYGGRDADGSPGNNFAPFQGELACCDFRIDPSSLGGVVPQARARAPARIDQGRLRSFLPMDLGLVLTIGRPPFPELRVERALIGARLPSRLGVIEDGLLGGAIPARSLWRLENPYCRSLSALCPNVGAPGDLLELVASMLPPDVDLSRPRNGLERLERGATGRIERCSFADGRAIEPVSPLDPSSCASAPEFADGYSLALGFHAVAARAAIGL